MASDEELRAIGIIRDSNTSNVTTNIKNSVATIIKGLAILEVVIAIIVGLITIEEFGIFVIVGSIISAIFIYALGEIIQKLENIDNNTRKSSIVANDEIPKL